MLRRIVSRFLIRQAARSNYALRTPIDQVKNSEFVTNTPNPFHTEKRVVTGSEGKPDVTVITRPALHGTHCTIGIILPSGSRNGINMPSGISHLDEKMAFGPTTESFNTREQVRQFLDSNGGICDSQTDQETTIFALSISRDAIDEAVMLLTETAFRPRVDLESCIEALQNVDNDVRYLKYEKIREKEILELACQAGFRGNTIGLPRMMPAELIEKCSEVNEIEKWKNYLLQHRRDNYLKKSPAFVGIGVKTDELEAAINKHRHLIDNPSWSNVQDPSTKDNSISQWTGGFRHQNEEAVNSFSIGEQENASYFCIGWEAPGYKSDHEKYSAHVLRALLGGGSSFESGGPGKGLKCILYQNVLGSISGQHFTHFKSFYKEFTDSGIFGIYGKGPKEKAKLGLNMALQTMRKIEQGNFTTEDIERAKTQLTAQFLRDMEVRAMMMEAFARETVAYGAPVNPSVTCEKIQKVQTADLVSLSRKLLNTVPSVSILGESDENSKLYNDVCMAQFNNQPLVVEKERKLYMTQEGKYFYA